MAWWNPFAWSEKAVDNVLDKDSGLLVKAVYGRKLRA